MLLATESGNGMTEDYGSGLPAKPGSPEPKAASGFLSILGNLFRSPSRMMDGVGANPRWWPPGLIIFLVLVLFSASTLHIQIEESLQISRESRLAQWIPQEHLEQQEELLDNLTLSARIGAGLQFAFLFWIAILIMGFLWGFMVRMSGGQGGFKTAVAIVSWSAVPIYALGSLIKLPIILQQERMTGVTLSLAALLPGDEITPLVLILANFGDFLVWWGLYLVIVGFSRNSGLTMRVSAITIILPWLLLRVVYTGFAILSIG